MDTQYWNIKTREDMHELFEKLCGEYCDSFRGTLSCWPTDDKASKSAGYKLEFIDWAGHVIGIMLGLHTHVVLTSNGILQTFTDEEFIKFQGVFVAIYQGKGINDPA